MSEVNQEQAAIKAREAADYAVETCYHPRARQSMAAQFLWSRTFRREYDSFTKPSPITP